jgi:hypothetical protein
MDDGDEKWHFLWNIIQQFFLNLIPSQKERTQKYQIWSSSFYHGGNFKRDLVLLLLPLLRQGRLVEANIATPPPSERLSFHHLGINSERYPPHVRWKSICQFGNAGNGRRPIFFFLALTGVRCLTWTRTRN